MRFKVRYYAGPYSGTRTVEADDEEHAVAVVRARVRREMSLSMYSDGYRVVGEEDSDESEGADGR